MTEVALSPPNLTKSKPSPKCEDHTLNHLAAQPRSVSCLGLQKPLRSLVLDLPPGLITFFALIFLWMDPAPTLSSRARQLGYTGLCFVASLILYISESAPNPDMQESVKTPHSLTAPDDKSRPPLP